MVVNRMMFGWGCPVAHNVCAPFELKVFIGNNAVFCVYTVRVLWPVFLFSFLLILNLCVNCVFGFN